MILALYTEALNKVFAQQKVLPPGAGFYAPPPSNHLHADYARSGWIREREQLAFCSILIIAKNVDAFYFQRTQCQTDSTFMTFIPFSARLHAGEVFGGWVWLNHTGRQVKLTLVLCHVQLVQSVQDQHPQSNTIINFDKCLEEAKLLQVFLCFRTNNFVFLFFHSTIQTNVPFKVL